MSIKWAFGVYYYHLGGRARNVQAVPLKKTVSVLV